MGEQDFTGFLRKFRLRRESRILRMHRAQTDRCDGAPRKRDPTVGEQAACRAPLHGRAIATTVQVHVFDPFFFRVFLFFLLFFPRFFRGHMQQMPVCCRDGR